MLDPPNACKLYSFNNYRMTLHFTMTKSKVYIICTILCYVDCQDKMKK